MTGHVLSLLNQPEDDDPRATGKLTLPVPEGWPAPPRATVYHGLVGEIVQAIAPETEADPVATLSQLLVAFGAAVGRGGWFQVEATRHYPNQFLVLIGDSARARKGSSWDHVHRLIAGADPAITARILTGLSSGEGLIWSVRDPAGQDPGSSDRRLLVIEPEFVSVLKNVSREISTLSPTLRSAWDGRPLAILTRTAPARATDAHISIIGHITATELQHHINPVELANGLLNRFLLLSCRRVRLLPEGGDPDPLHRTGLDHKLAKALQAAQHAGQIRLSSHARRAWIDAYQQLAEPQPGIAGAISARAEAHTIRLALIYTLLDSAREIQPPHLTAALALWAIGSVHGLGASMTLTWLHLSDFHMRSGDSYDRDVVLGSLLASVRRFGSAGRRPDMVFASGDVAFSGKAGEYAVASAFFEQLLDAVELERSRLFVIAGNHDVDRDRGVGLARTLVSGEEADAYFAPDYVRPHLTHKQGAFMDWYREFFSGIRECPVSSCGPVELVEAGGVRVGVLPINSALFCQGDDDHAKLWVGRRSLDGATRDLQELSPDLRIALIHHPLDWLADRERASVRAKLAECADVLLRGHLHETDVAQVVSPQGGVVHLAAGAAYQTRRWPNCAQYVTVEDSTLRVFPIRFEDSPTEVWTVDPSVFPDEPGHTGLVSILAPRSQSSGAHITADSTPPSGEGTIRRFRSNVPSRRGQPFVGRHVELVQITKRLDDTADERVLVLAGAPGVGKTELAREFARRQRDRYPGGTFSIDATSANALVDLVRLAVNFLGMEFSTATAFEDQCQQSLAALGAAPTLLLYDNVQSFEAVERWLPPAGMPCHVVITALVEPPLGWSWLHVEPLTPEHSVQLIEALAGPEVAKVYGPALAAHSGGLPVEICPVAVLLGDDHRRGRRRSPNLSAPADETRTSFSLAYQHLHERARLLLHAAAALNPQRIDRAELNSQLKEAVQWSELDFSEAVDACTDLRLLQGDTELTMHQLFASFLRATAVDGELAHSLSGVREVQHRRLVTVAAALQARPADGAAAALLTGFALEPEIWGVTRVPLTAAEDQMIGTALVEIGQFEQARPWFEQAVREARNEDVHGSVDHERVGRALHSVGYCYSRVGEFEQARPLFEEAVNEARRGDIYGRVDHESLGSSLHQVATCYSRARKFEQARPLFEEAVEQARKGNIDGHVDHESVGSTLHEVGICHASVDDFEEARVWFEEAVEAKSEGDIYRRVDHESLGISLHQVGICHASVNQFEEARPWFEEAVDAKREGDIHGRINHQTLGVSLHQVGICYASVNRFEEARPWFQEAVEEKRKGDIHGRIDHQSLGSSLHRVGMCHTKVDAFEQARPWFEEAVTEARAGDIYGRVDHQSLGNSLHQVGICHANAGEFEQARPLFEEAVEEVGEGDVHGRVDHKSLQAILVSGARCLRELGEPDVAARWEAEAQDQA